MVRRKATGATLLRDFIFDRTARHWVAERDSAISDGDDVCRMDRRATTQANRAYRSSATRIARGTFGASRLMLTGSQERSTEPWVLIAGGFHEDGGMDQLNAGLARYLMSCDTPVDLVACNNGIGSEFMYHETCLKGSFT
jgi:hypothetical protein